MNPLLNKLSRNDHGQRAEKRTAQRLGGRMQPGSGSQQHSKGDIKLPDFLIENKSTIHASMGLQHAWFRKIAAEAIAINREPALSFQFVDGAGRPLVDGKWVAIPERLFKELTTK